MEFVILLGMKFSVYSYGFTAEAINKSSNLKLNQWQNEASSSWFSGNVLQEHCTDPSEKDSSSKKYTAQRY